MYYQVSIDFDKIALETEEDVALYAQLAKLLDEDSIEDIFPNTRIIGGFECDNEKELIWLSNDDYFWLMSQDKTQTEWEKQVIAFVTKNNISYHLIVERQQFLYLVIEDN